MRVVLLVALHASALAGCHTLPTSQRGTAGHAGSLEIARAEFTQTYRYWGSNYRVRPSLGEYDGESCYFFEGTGKFSRPGYAAIVCVNRSDNSETYPW